MAGFIYRGAEVKETATGREVVVLEVSGAAIYVEHECGRCEWVTRDTLAPMG